MLFVLCNKPSHAMSMEDQGIVYTSLTHQEKCEVSELFKQLCDNFKNEFKFRQTSKPKDINNQFGETTQRCLEGLLDKMPQQPTTTFFYEIRELGIKLYQHCFQTNNDFTKLEGHTLRNFRILTQLLEKIYMQLNSDDQKIVQETLSQELRDYLKELRGIHTKIRSQLLTCVKKSQYFSKKEMPLLNDIVDKFHDATSNKDESYISLGQSLAYQTVITQILFPEEADKYFLLPFSKGSALGMLPEKGSPELVEQYYNSYRGGLTTFDELTKIEQIIFEEMTTQLGLSEKKITICDRLEQMMGLNRLVNFLTQNNKKEKNPLLRFCCQVYDAENGQENATDQEKRFLTYTSNPLFKELMATNSITLFDKIQLKDRSGKRQMCGKLTAENMEMNRLVPVMSPELWMFGIPHIARHGLAINEAVISNIGCYFSNYYKRLEDNNADLKNHYINADLFNRHFDFDSDDDDDMYTWNPYAAPSFAMPTNNLNNSQSIPSASDNARTPETRAAILYNSFEPEEPSCSAKIKSFCSIM